MFTEKERNVIKNINGYVMKTPCCRLRKFTEHRSDSDIKQMSILLEGTDSSDSSTKELISSTSETEIVS